MLETHSTVKTLCIFPALSGACRIQFSHTVAQNLLPFLLSPLHHKYLPFCSQSIRQTERRRKTLIVTQCPQTPEAQRVSLRMSPWFMFTVI